MKRPSEVSRLEHHSEHALSYDGVDDGAYSALRAAHRDLDLAVLAAYGWSSGLLDDVRRRNRALLDLNGAIVRRHGNGPVRVIEMKRERQQTKTRTTAK